MDSAYILASRVFDTQAEIHIHVVDRQWPKWIQVTWVNRQNEKKTNKKPMESNVEEDSIVSAGVHTSSVCGVRAACERQHHNPSSNGNHLNLFAEQQELGKRLVPHGFHPLVFF